jgi:hypothetical protein
VHRERTAFLLVARRCGDDGEQQEQVQEGEGKTEVVQLLKNLRQMWTEARDDVWGLAVIGKEGVLVWARVGIWVILPGISTLEVQCGPPRPQIWQKYKNPSLSYGKYVKVFMKLIFEC